MANPQPHQTQPDPIYENIGDASAFRDIYYLSPDGNVSCGSTKPIEGELKKYADVFSPPTLGLKLATQKYQEATPSAASDSRLTLIYLDVYFKVKPLETEASKTKPCPPQYPDRVNIMDGYNEIPKRYRNELEGKEFDNKDKFCCHCTVAGEILWRNIVEAQSRYESRFRTWKTRSGVCFLQFHTMQVPYLTSWNVILALVHHIHIPRQRSQNDIPHVENRDEKIFAFVLGLNKENIDGLWTMVKRYHEHEVVNTNIGITPKMFVAAFLKLYGFLAAKEYIRGSLSDLSWVDEQLIDAERELSELEYPCNKEQQEKLKERIGRCNKLNQKLMEINKNLTGVRSRVHYIGLCARGLMREESTMERYIRDECSRGVLAHLHRAESAPPELPANCQDFDDEITQFMKRAKTDPQRKTNSEPARSDLSLHVENPPPLEKALSSLDSSRYTRRDNDKLDMISRAMTQYEVDIKSLKAQATMAVGLVSNLYAHCQGDFHNVILHATEKDSKNMEVTGTLTVLLLPATFWAVIIATPMIQWAPVQVAPISNPDASYQSIDHSPPTVVWYPFMIWLGLFLGTTLSLWLFLQLKTGKWSNGRKSSDGKGNGSAESSLWKLLRKPVRTRTSRVGSHSC